MTSLLEYFSIFKDAYGPLSFRIEEIGNAEDFVMFLSRFEINLRLTEIKISFDSNENFSFIMQNLSMDPTKFTWIDINREGVFMSNYEKMFKTLRLHLAAYVECKCDNGKCYFITIYEEKNVQELYSRLRMLLEEGVRISIEMVMPIIINESGEERRKERFDNLENVI